MAKEFDIETAFERALSRNEETSVRDVLEQYCGELGIPYEEKYRHRVSRRLQNKKEAARNSSSTTTQGYDKEPKEFSAIGEDGKMMPIEKYCEHYGLDMTKVKSYKLVSHTSIPYYNIVFFETKQILSLTNLQKYLDETVAKHITPVEVKPRTFLTENNIVDRLVYTDVHIGMSVNGNGDPLYGGKWDKDELLKRLEALVNHTLDFQCGNILRIDDLGDYLDGLKGETTRKGHKLPQNMNDKEVFDLGVEFKVKLVDALIGHYDTIICTNLCEDNHSGIFSYFVNQAVKGILEQKYPGIVEVVNQKKFIDHYTIGKHTIILCHGKDSESLKFGFKPQLDEKQERKIDHYCKENHLYNGNFIEFSKGDSHLALYDESTSKDFHYYNYPAFSPPSNWVKTCFSNTKSGFKFYNIHKDKNLKVAIPYWF